MKRSANTGFQEDPATGDRIPPEYMGMAMDAPPLGGWTKQWIEHPHDHEAIQRMALEDMQASVKMWERAVDDGGNEYCQEWLKRSREDLAKLEAWLK